jgi:hypothetical protein
MRRLRYLLLIFCASTFFNAFGQKNHFKKYTNSVHHFYFLIPENWDIKYNAIDDSWVCTPLSPEEKAAYARCYGGIVFKMDFYFSGLDEALLNIGGPYTKVGGSYYTSGRYKVKAKNIKGPGWGGIYYNNACGINCSGKDFNAATGECEDIYFSNGKITVLLETNGRSIDKSVLDMLVKSIHFY